MRWKEIYDMIPLTGVIDVGEISAVRPWNIYATRTEVENTALLLWLREDRGYSLEYLYIYADGRAVLRPAGGKAQDMMLIERYFPTQWMECIL